MDNNKLPFIAFGLVLTFLLFPIITQKARGPVTVAASAPGQIAAKALTLEEKYPQLAEPPLLNASNIIGTEWQVTVYNYKVKIKVVAGGIVYATHPMAKALTGMDYAEGKWEIVGNRLRVSAAYVGEVYTTELIIAGNKLWFMNSKGEPEEVKRF